MDLMKKRWHRYHYKNLTYLAISFILAFVLLRTETFRIIIAQLGNYKFLGAFAGGMLFVSTFTVSIGAVILLFLAKTMNPVEIGLIAGAGAVLSNLVIFRFIQSRELMEEIKHFFHYFGGDKISHLIHSKYFSWTLPVIGALIIASPFPDELGVGLMGIAKMKTWEFILLSFILNSIGIFLVVMGSTMLKI